MRCAAALSEHPVAPHALGECAGRLLDTGLGPDLALLFASGAHAGSLEAMADAVASLLGPRVLLGATATGVLGEGRGAEGRAAVAVWAAWFDPGTPAPVPVRLTAAASAGAAGEVEVDGAEPLRNATGTLLLISASEHPSTADLPATLGMLAPGLVVVGGRTAGAGARLLVRGPSLPAGNDRPGAVGVWLPPGVPTRVVVGPGHRPVGPAMAVTAADGPLLLELAGRPAIDALDAVIDSLDPELRALAAMGLHLGVEGRATGDDDARLRVEPLLGMHRRRGALATGHPLPLGSVVRFVVPDPLGAAGRFARALVEADADRAAGSLVFSAAGRSSSVPGGAERDAAELLDIGSHPHAGLVAELTLAPFDHRTSPSALDTTVVLWGVPGD